MVRNGLLKVRAGDPVAAGDLLVAGTIPIYDDSENLVSSHEIRADAEVYARTVYETEKKLPLTYEVNEPDGEGQARGIFQYLWQDLLFPDAGLRGCFLGIFYGGEAA